MNRRTVLTIGMVGLELTLIGCLGDSPDTNGSEGEGPVSDDTTTESTDSGSPIDPGDTDSPTDTMGTDTTTIRETSFEVVNVQTSSQEETASVTVEDKQTTVTGTIRGNNGCYTSRLGDATIDNDTLIVNIESFEDANVNQDCIQATVTIEYRATVKIVGKLPTIVEVEHNGEVVKTE